MATTSRGAAFFCATRRRRRVDPLRAFQSQVHDAVQAALASMGAEADLPIESPPDPAMGDAGVPCFTLAKTLRKAPAAIAQDLSAKIGAALQGAADQWIGKVHCVGPYVNFFIDASRLGEAVFMHPAAAVAPRKKAGLVLLEHTSANPNGPLHVGRARNPILGDTLARVLRAAGHDVETQYYMDNLGRQVALLYYGHEHIAEGDLPPAAREKPDHRLVRYYQAANDLMERDEAVAAQVKDLVVRLEAADPALLAGVRKVYEACFAGMRQSLERLGVAFDSIKDESDLVEAGDVDETIQGLQKSPRWAREEDGANYLDLAQELGGSKSTKFFFTRKDGTSVYATRDVAYHKWKAEHVGPEGRLIDVLGEDHRLQAVQVKIALEQLGHQPPTVVFYAFVSLPEGKMSTRANRVVFLDDLLDEAVVRARAAVQERRGDEMDEGVLQAIAEAVGIAAIRYNIVRIQAEKPIQFRWEEALDFESGAPYLLYAHARAASLLRRAEAEGITPRFDAALAGAGEQSLALAIARYLPALEDAARDLAPHRLCTYVLDLAGAFNEYYRDHPVIQCEDEAVRATRAACVAAAQQALAASLRALGLPVLDAM